LRVPVQPGTILIIITLPEACMTQPKVFITRRIPEKGLSKVREHCQVRMWPEPLPPSPQALLENVRGMDGLLCLLTDRIDAELMDAALPRLKVISNHAVGYDNIDIAAATQRCIPVGNTPGILTETTADFAFALLMAAARRLVEGEHCVHSGGWKTWDPLFLLGVDIFGATLGIVGFGRIGQALARRAAGFNMRILYYDPSPIDPLEAAQFNAQAVDLDTLLAQADFVSIHTPLNAQTYHLFDQGVFAQMKSSAILINTARGGVVDPQALYQALKERRIAAAAIDVTEPEPIPTDSPLLELDNLLITPHIASASQATRDKMASMAAENLLAGLKGERLPYCVNPQVYG
jgi:glyoxylate reductase